MIQLLKNIKKSLNSVLHPLEQARIAAEGRALLTELVEVNEHLQKKVKTLQARVNTCNCGVSKTKVKPVKKK